MTEIVCKCGTSRIEDVQCAECGEYFKAGWIPVSKRLPEREDKSCIGERYLVLYFNYFEDICVYAPYDKLWFREGVDKTEYVTHWMPLPPPPEAE